MFRKLLYFVLIILLIVLASVFAYSKYISEEEQIEVPVAIEEPIKEVVKPEEKIEEEVIEEVHSKKLDVPFTAQAPYADWSEPYQEACEEVSIIMVNAYYKDQILDKKTAKQEILDIVEYEQSLFGFYKDTDIEQTAELAKKYWKYEKVEILEDPTVEDLKKELVAGRPIVVPAAGRELGNPNFTAPGPVYHVLVITGFEGDEFITNDPGTRKGEGYRYEMDVLMNAIHDFNKKDISLGEKRVLVIYK